MRPAHLAILTAFLVLTLGVKAARADSIAVVVPADGLRLRAGPGSEYQILDLIPGGTRIAIAGQPTADGWYPAVYRGQRGWVLSAFLAFDELTAAAARRATVAPPDGLNLRVAPYEGADIIMVLTGGSVVTATGQATTDGWALVQVAEHSGWVSAAYLAFDTGSSFALSAAPVALASPSAGPARTTITYYHPSFEGSRMNCGGVYHADDPTIAATNAWPCGTALRVCSGAACVVVTVKDRGGMGPNEIDLSAAAFARLAPLGTGIVYGTIDVVTP